MPSFLARILNPFGPMITPATISPTMPGILNLLKTNGASKMMNSTNENTSTGSFNGRVKSGKLTLKKCNLFIIG